MRCATGTPATGAHINAHTNAHIIFPRTSVPSEMARTAFCQLRTSFFLVANSILPAAQVILPWGAHHFDEGPDLLEPELPSGKAISAGMETDGQDIAWPASTNSWAACTRSRYEWSTALPRPVFSHMSNQGLAPSGLAWTSQ